MTEMVLLLASNDNSHQVFWYQGRAEASTAAKHILWDKMKSVAAPLRLIETHMRFDRAMRAAPFHPRITNVPMGMGESAQWPYRWHKCGPYWRKQRSELDLIQILQ